MANLLVLLAGLTLSLGHFYGEKIFEAMHHQYMAISFTAGISISYIFIGLFPEVIGRGAIVSMRTAFGFVLLGFTLEHVVEKYIVKHETPGKAREELAELHALAFFLYYFIIGLVIVPIFDISLRQGALFTAPVFLHTLTGSAAMENIHHGTKGNTIIRAALSLSPLLGVVTALYATIPEIVFRLALGFVVGVLLMIVIRDYIPSGEKGHPDHFLAGVILYSLVIALTLGM